MRSRTSRPPRLRTRCGRPGGPASGRSRSRRRTAGPGARWAGAITPCRIERFKGKVFDMTEQIVDLMEANMPGPRGATGPQGPQGLPGVDAVPADEAVAAYVLGDSATQQALAGLKGRWGSHVPFFGDSITAGYLSGGVTFRDVLSSTFGFEDHNYAAGGEGFYRAGQSGGDIAHEVANSKSDDSYDHSRVRLAVVCGGVNDVDRDVTKGRDGVRRVMEAIRGEYPNATILLASGLGGAFNPTYGRLDHRNVGYYDAIVSEGMARGAMIAPDAFTWVGTDDTLLADGLHPNASGHRVIGAHLSNILAGLADPTAVTDASGQITKTADQDTLDAKLHVAGRSVRLYLHLWHILTDADFDESLGGVRFVMCRTPNWLELPGYRTGAVLGFDGEYNTLNQHYWSIGNGSASMVIRQASGARQMETGMKLDISISVDTVLA
nr:MAG TPA: hydrolase [Caudoviricetes sp.]